MTDGVPQQEQRPSISLSDVYHVLFRHKWKIVLCSIAGSAAAIASWLLMPPPYQSEAKLLIRYVMEARPSATGDEARVKSPDERGETIISGETQILTSFDLALQVADSVGPERILGKTNVPSAREAAATVLRKSLVVEVPQRSSVIRLVFSHHDPQLVQPVLKQVIDSYFKKHLEIHQAGGVFGDFLTQETDSLRQQLSRTEQELRKARNLAGVVSLDDAKRTTSERLARIDGEISTAEAELAERQAALRLLQKSSPTTPTTTTNQESTASATVIEEYRKVCSRLALLWTREAELQTQYTAENSLVKDIHNQVVQGEEAKRKLEQDNPDLVRLGMTPAASSATFSAGVVDLSGETARVAALESRIKILHSQRDQVWTNLTKIDEMEPTILELQRKKGLQETNYWYLSTSLEHSRIDEALGAGKVANISRIQAPSPAYREGGKNLKRMLAMAVGGIVAGLAWAFGQELYLDSSVKRPVEIEVKLGMPLFLSIPDICRKGGSRKKLARKRRGELPAPKAGEAAKAETASEGMSVAPWEGNSRLRCFYETLRDKLIYYFELNNLTRKPKLVAVTGVGHGSGVSSIAAGLAESLSETGDGRVLLVDMNADEGAVQPFYQGKPHCSLDVALEQSSRDEALVQENLYVVAERSNRDRIPQVLPKRFSSLVPKLKGSDYDYIIFDMPPVSQTSITPRLAGFMDMVLFVIEAEKTNVDSARHANALLRGRSANVAAIVNKTRCYVPKWLHHDLSET